ncbi:MAG: septal ring lytic transglycosylase RlpA family protein [Bacteroidia bacterium]|nr:septal ring lytic transglycosylase RlpA family protein [Bacteroidia bacterium]
MRFFLFILIVNIYFKSAVAQDSLSITSTTTGIASFYAKKFNGRKTASGQKFSQDSLTAAHKTLTFGTYVLVRNLKNDSTVIVRINDRLPKHSKRSIDLTYRAAKQLNFIKAGLTKVEITPLDTLKK